LGISVACFTVMVWMLHAYSPGNIRDLPEVWVLFTITALIIGGVVSCYVPLVETMLDWVGREHARAWVSLLTVVKSMINVGALYIWIRCSPDGIPSIMIWMTFAVIGGTFGTLIDTFLAPMIFDYMPRSQMGTINSGKGIYESFVRFIIPNLGAWWVVFYSTHIHKPAHVPYDYTSMYLLQFALFIPAIFAKIYFVRLILKGRLTKRGILDLEEAEVMSEMKHEFQLEGQVEETKAQQIGEGP
jgi:hypothetical protein